MAFPFTWEENFELGTRGLFDATSGTLHDFPHYTELARQGMAPYRGAYCARWRAIGGTTQSYLQETTSFDIAAAGTLFFRWYFYLGKDFLMADGDKFSMVELESVASTTTEIAAGIIRTGANILFWFNETSAAASPTTYALGTTTTALGRWIHVEMKVLVDSGVGNDGTIDVWIDDAPLTQITTLDQGAIVDARFGMIGPDAGTSGTFLIDAMKADDTQIYRDKERFPGRNVWMTAAQDHVLIGPGKFSVAVTGTSTDAVLTLYDTDGIPTNLAPFLVLRNLVANEFVPAHDILEVNYGCYATLTGTQAQAFFSVDSGGVVSQGAYVSRGIRQIAPRP